MQKYIHISSGRGPMECALVVKKVLGKLQADAQVFDLKTTVIQRNTGAHPSGLSSVTLALKGQNLFPFLSKWEGSILWVSKSPFRPQHRRKNWFIEVFGVDLPEETSISEKDVVFQATKSSGPGGQHVNKTSSAIRATHSPTGASVLVQDSRSQHQNKKIALARLEEEIKKINQNTFSNFESEQWLKKINVQRGNPSLVFEGTDFNQVLKT